ncbi:hypothetical protein FPZ43_10860 [Mucilaginibacter pallidiroseus]|uniref:Uncharacterized protein n=1 Tax=Mucilaginibacter pallidiroseus TaxID=2599295 RepID=A0A563UDI2_9SPHI|nr:hypothetical protein [Mucilaginibacter pallidiroseus]TWR29442.1 hypothetical protein FPZ43_10860 [Mucilaginibacter pallidiroseus]
MIDFQNHKYDLVELAAIFAKDTRRRDFIFYYDNWGEDNNENFYTKFIDENICKGKTSRQDDAIEVSIRAGIFRGKYFDCVKAILHSRKGHWIKLTCLDWLYEFSNKIDTAKYIELNTCYMRRPNLSELNKVQATLNLLKTGTSRELSAELYSQLLSAEIPGTFYRVKILLTDSSVKFNETSKPDMVKVFVEIATHSSSLSESQKRDIVIFD